MKRIMTIVVGFALFTVGACSKPLPEPESVDAQLYALRCNGCHPAYQPSLMTAAMWGATIDRMVQRQLPAAGTRLGVREREMIEAYLARHARGSVRAAEPDTSGLEGAGP